MLNKVELPLHKIKVYIVIVLASLYVMFSINLANNNANLTKYYISRSIFSKGALDMPKILTTQDLQTYWQINQYIEQSQYKLAQPLYNKVQNNILIGYFLYLKYTSKNYKSTFNELKAWLLKYHALPVAPVIYKIAKNKFSYSSKLMRQLKKPSNDYFYGFSVPYYNNHPDYTNKNPIIELPPEDVGITPNLQSNYNTRLINAYFKKGQNTAAARLLANPKVKKQLNKYTYYHYASVLSKVYFLDGNDNLAILWGKAVVENMQQQFPEASFTLGLAYFRLKQYDKASVYFYYLAKGTTKFTTDIIAKGAYWYAKTNFTMGNYKKYTEGLVVAAKYIYNFYGLLANEELGINPEYSFEYVNFEQTSLSRLQKEPRAKRAFALLQMGLLDWAEQELIWLANDIVNNKIIDVEKLEALLYVAQQTNMPALSYKLAGARGMYYGLSHLAYPIFLIDLGEDYTVDPALLLAFMRRESQFYTSASSYAGAKGLMQLLPQTAKFIANKYNLTNSVDYSTLGLYSAKNNIKLGEKYVKTLIDNEITQGDLISVLIGFNAGVLKAKDWFTDKHRRYYQDPIFFIESIPYYETRAYVKSVLTDYWVYQFKLNIPHTTLELITKGYYPLYNDISLPDLERIKNFSYLNNSGANFNNSINN